MQTVFMTNDPVTGLVAQWPQRKLFRIARTYNSANQSTVVSKR